MKRTLATLCCALALAGCSSLNPFADSGPKPAALAPIQATAQLQPLWQARVGDAGPYVFQPAVLGDAVVAAAEDGSVVRLQGGRVEWKVSAGKRLSAGVGAGANLAVVVTAGGDVVALDPANGAERWRTPVGAEVLAAPAVGEAFVVVRTSDSRLIGLDAASGARRWVYQRNTPPLSLRSFAGVTLESGAALAGYPGGKLVAVSLANGGQLWELSVATPRGSTEIERIADVAGTPVLGRRELCAVAFQGRVACFDPGNGNAMWSREFSSSVGMDLDARLAVITNDGDIVHGLEAGSGNPLWKQEGLARRGVTRPLITGSYVAVADAEGYVHLLDRSTGVFAARARVGSDAVLAAPRPFGQGGFVVQNRGGDLQVFEVR